METSRACWPGRHPCGRATSRPSGRQPKTNLPLQDFDPSETLSVLVQAASGNLKPIVVQCDYDGSPLRLGDPLVDLEKFQHEGMDV